jgi:2-methylcitrate dehydratase PrpD
MTATAKDTATATATDTATQCIVRIVREGRPGPAAIAEATGQLLRFRRCRSAGAAPAALAAIAVGRSDPMWKAWLSGAAAATADAAAGPAPDWTAVCAAAAALTDDEERAATAVALGCRVAGLVAETLGAGHTEAGWDLRSTAGGIGAGAAAGWLCGLDEEALRHAIGLCATQAAGLTGSAGTDAEALQRGKAAGNAVEAALLAQCGLTSSVEPLEGRRGMFALMAPGGPATRE